MPSFAGLEAAGWLRLKATIALVLLTGALSFRHHQFEGLLPFTALTTGGQGGQAGRVTLSNLRLPSQDVWGAAMGAGEWLKGMGFGLGQYEGTFRAQDIDVGLEPDEYGLSEPCVGEVVLWHEKACPIMSCR